MQKEVMTISHQIISSEGPSKVNSHHDAGKETLVGFHEEARRLIEQLMGGKKQLQTISIVGMTGLGKTTLAREVFNDPSVVYRFQVRAWTTVTQVPQKIDLLLGILKSGFAAEDDNTNDMELSLMLKRRLSGQRFLIVMDDIWDIGTWNDLKLCFPDDKVGSRIIFTSRLVDMPLQTEAGCYQHCLRFLTDKESWDLLQFKVFLKESCPPGLAEIGVNIARKCRGLPLAIVVIAGILANDMTTNWRSHVAQDLSSIAGNAPEHYMETLELSYNHLPNHLKPCFLYFAAFPEDYEIRTWKLILFWVAEGFIEIRMRENNFEDVAAGYLKDLIGRSLVIVSERGSNGGIKTPIIHDLLRDLCIKKTGEMIFLHQMETKRQYVSRSMVRRLCSSEFAEENFFHELEKYFNFQIRTLSISMVLGLCVPNSLKRAINSSRAPSPRNVKSILCCSSTSGNSFAEVSCADNLYNFLWAFKFLRVMDLSSTGLSRFPSDIVHLRKLRYIGGRYHIKCKYPNINLQTQIPRNTCCR